MSMERVCSTLFIHQIVDNNFSHSLKIEDLLYDYELEFGNVICMFIYKKEDHLELSFLTSPNKNIPRLNIKER